VEDLLESKVPPRQLFGPFPWQVAADEESK
jgi:hypothetical protein